MSQRLKSSQAPGTNPFISGGGGADDVFGPNTQIRIKKSQLDHLQSQIKSNIDELERLKQIVEEGKTKTKEDFIRMSKSLVFKHDYKRGKPLVISYHQIRQLAMTPVGYGLNMLELFEMTDKMRNEQKMVEMQRQQLEEMMMSTQII